MRRDCRLEMSFAHKSSRHDQLTILLNPFNKGVNNLPGILVGPIAESSLVVYQVIVVHGSVENGQGLRTLKNV